MENKYYTPEIEEFHPGFVFDLKRNEEQNWGINHIYGDTSPRFSKMRLYLHKNGCRVKYLDQSDIESLGFGSWTDSHGYWRCFKTVDDDKYLVLHRFRSGNTGIEAVDKVTGHRGAVFEGKIKNKSELITILKQIDE
jgi:hypothetical protein